VTGRVLAWSGALALGLVIGCLELPRGRSCGDGWWDPEYEECDKSSSDRSYVEACRDAGWDKDADCDPDTCEIRASELDCTVCGDGVASGAEACDGNDVRGATCPSGSGVVRCTPECALDYQLCPEVCGDGIVNGTEECEASLSCGSDEDCGPGLVCYPLFGECVPGGGGFGPNLSCSFYNTKAIGVDKPYASGAVERCTDDCFFGRNNCGFCGDGELDDSYTDFVYPQGDAVTFPGEICDGGEALANELEAYCEPLCVNDPINSDVAIFCDFECNANCTDFAPPDDIIPGQDPEALGCCLAEESPCPKFGTEGVPDLPCCSWLEHPEWLAEEKCVAKNTDQVPVPLVCP
jgi:hypothetical protein